MPSNLISVDQLQLKKENTSGYSSPRLLNWVEPYKINNVNKTAFYTEINTNIKVGDRVWIINGYYDSDNLIQENKYKAGRDGYKVLFIDKCKIVLDIDYTGVLPFNSSENIDNFVKVWKVSTREEFILASRQITTNGGQLNYKFDKNQNNMIFTDSSDSSIFSPVYTNIDTNNNIYGWGVNLGLTATPGFHVKNGKNYWLNITKDIFWYGTFSYALGTQSNDRLKVMNGSFHYNGFEFKDGFVYEWYKGPTNSHWRVDKNYLTPLLSKSNFRSGVFGGDFNNGVYGTNEKSITWTGVGNFNGGTVLNTNWSSGQINSNISLGIDYKATLKDGQVIQKTNTTNNSGNGYNYIIDSYFNKSNILNGNIINSYFGFTKNKSVVENHLMSITQSFNNTIKGYFENCSFSSLNIDSSTLINTKIYDSKIQNSKVVNSQVADSVIKDSTYITENSIKILAYDEWNISESQCVNLLNSSIGSTFSSFGSSAGTTHKVYKFYISEGDYNKLHIGDYFYIKDLKFNNSPSLINFFEKKLKVGNWTEFIDYYTTNYINYGFQYDAESFYKRGVDFSVLLSTPNDNKYILTSATASGQFFTYSGTQSLQWTNVGGLNPNSNYYSVDIVVSLRDIFSNLITDINFNYDSVVYSSTQSKFLENKVDITSAYIIESNFESGVFETSDWKSGFNINYNNDVNISSLTGSGIYNISIDDISNTLEVQTTQYGNNNETTFGIGDIIFLNSIDYINGDNITRLPDTWKVVSKNLSFLGLTEVNTNVISGLTAGGYFTTYNSENRWNYISKNKFYLSKIESGLFKRSYFNKSLLRNSVYDSSDKDFNNVSKIKGLLIQESIFSNSNNVLSSATYLNSFLIGGTDIWNDGIVHNSYLNGVTFSKGVVRQSFWNDGTFTGGTFYDSRSFDGNPSLQFPYYYTNRLKSYWRSGLTTATVSNNRYSWRNGTFTGGEFIKSDWENGLFKDGTFKYSKFYGGTFSGGRVGSPKSASGDTVIYNGDILYTTVDNATLYSKDPNYSGLSQSNINWYGGVFNNGLFGSYYQDTYQLDSKTYSFFGATGASINIPDFSATGSATYSLTSDSGYGIVISNDDVVKNIEVRLELTINGDYCNQLTINLKGPSGNIINIKRVGEGYGSLKSTVFSSNDNNLSLSQISSPYTTVGGALSGYPIFKMSKALGVGVPGYLSNTTNINDLISNGSINGNWDLIINDEISGKVMNLSDWSFVILYNNSFKSGSIENSAIWYDGIFNGGQFADYAKWKNGTFNGGKFISSLGWTASGNYYDNSIDINDYTWENGTFNDGEFGRGTLDTNSTWYNGTFNGGEFKGRLWNGGIFTNGNFNGSSTYSAIGGLDVLSYTQSNAAKFVDSYKSNFWGLWVDGIVTNKKDQYIKNKKFYYENNKFSKVYTNANLNNMLWLSGTFSHEAGTMNNSVWLGGTFNKGTFKNSSFNPYVNRGTTVDYQFTPNLNSSSTDTTTDRSVWLNGDFMGGDFYMSKWENGNFITGTAYGMIFNNGISKFMNAYNVTWNGGTWKNGNWYGSNFDYTQLLSNPFTRNVVLRGSLTHIWNIFETPSSNSLFSSSNATNISFDIFVEDPSINTGSNYNPYGNNVYNNPYSNWAHDPGSTPPPADINWVDNGTPPGSNNVSNSGY